MDQEAFFCSPVPGLMTLRDIASELGTSIEFVKRTVERNRIGHDRRHGVVKLWRRDQLDDIKVATRLPLPTRKGPE